MVTKLAICGKIVNIEKIAEKSLAQFADQLRRNGIQLPDEEVKATYDSLKQRIADEVEYQNKLKAQQEGAEYVELNS